MLRRTKRTHFGQSAVGSLPGFARIRKCRWRRRPAFLGFVPVGSVRASGEARPGQTVDHAAHHLSDCLRLRCIGPFGTHAGSRVRSSPVGEELPARYGRAHFCWVPEDGAVWRQPPSNSASTCRGSQIRDGTSARARPPPQGGHKYVFGACCCKTPAGCPCSLRGVPTFVGNRIKSQVVLS